ncbi:hypothetical protein MAR_034780, partial [Mya arenaria]
MYHIMFASRGRLHVDDTYLLTLVLLQKAVLRFDLEEMFLLCIFDSVNRKIGQASFSHYTTASIFVVNSVLYILNFAKIKHGDRTIEKGLGAQSTSRKARSELLRQCP